MPTIFLWTAHYNMFWHVIAFLVQCKIEFYFTHEPQNLYFHWWFLPFMKILHLVFIWWNKIQSDCEKIKISSTYYGISGAWVNKIISMTSLQKTTTKKKKKRRNSQNYSLHAYTGALFFHFSSISIDCSVQPMTKKWKKIRTKTNTKYQTRQGQNIYNKTSSYVLEWINILLIRFRLIIVPSPLGSNRKVNHISCVSLFTNFTVYSVNIESMSSQLVNFTSIVLARVVCETSQVLLAGGQVVLLGDLPFSAHLTNDSAQNEWNNLDPNKTQIKKNVPGQT